MKWKQTNWKEILLTQLIKQIYSIYKDTTEKNGTKSRSTQNYKWGQMWKPVQRGMQMASKHMKRGFTS